MEDYIDKFWNVVLNINERIKDENGIGSKCG